MPIADLDPFRMMQENLEKYKILWANYGSPYFIHHFGGQLRAKIDAVLPEPHPYNIIWTWPPRRVLQIDFTDGYGYEREDMRKLVMLNRKIVKRGDIDVLVDDNTKLSFGPLTPGPGYEVVFPQDVWESIVGM